MNNRNLIVAVAVVALLTIAATTAGCSTNTTPTPTPIPATEATVGNNSTFSSAAGFNITYPTNLAIDRNGTENALQPVRLYIYLNPNEKADGVVVATLKNTSSQNLYDFVNYNLGEITNYANAGVYKNFTKLNETNSTLAGNPAYTIVFSGIIPTTYSTTLTTNKSVKEMQTYVVNNSTGYVVTYKTLTNDYNTYLAQAQRIMNSFVLT